MGRDTCKYPTCDEPARDYQQGEVSSKEARFCSDVHQLKFEDIKDDAIDARMDDQERGVPDRDLPERDPPDVF